MGASIDILWPQAEPSAMEANDDISKTSLFVRHDEDLDYWSTYLKARPKYSDEFYRQLVAYHGQESNYDSAVDIGSGPGQVAGKLVDHGFKHVVASDCNESHLNAARLLLANKIDTGKASIALVAGEEIAGHVEAGTVDMVTVAEAMPLMDATAALDAWHQILKPDGTLAIWFYGRPTFIADDGQSLHDGCNAAYTRIIQKAFWPFISPEGSPGRPFWQRAVDTMHSRLDNIALMPSHWLGVQRHYWNCDGEMTLHEPDIRGLTKRHISNVQPSEAINERIDRSWWAEDWSVAEVKRFASVNLPAFSPSMMDGDDWKPLLKDMEDALSGSGGRRRVTWPVVLILARKA
ncbi:S-adenosyl-L-methionine-dependent methyltransferase [Polychaeton citri CBS 116435]|uniref:S-adenosyl-L-methionine-dependent methyltransferase n=1 Tax=Polychaeton citri CBS 116435 TaxID=1314669 RepID=A0A9P4Q3G0_9PEZI|nr:S-adenosyl-L-methionine-dependent methyltransferase [Polychaeton citri CBS 116435]